MSEVKACPMPWCEAKERGPDFVPVVRLHHFGNYRVVCTSCVCEGPLRKTEAEAIAAWNTRADSDVIGKLVEALEWYAQPHIYKPHPHGPAFDDRDLSWHAKSVLAALSLAGEATTSSKAGSRGG